MNKMYHVFNEGDNVLFRDNSDYIFFNNKFASSCYTYQLLPLAETTMSTHFHSLIEVADETVIEKFILKLKKAYSMYYAAKYGFTVGSSIKISKLEISGRESIMNELLYVMKNPVHHYVCAYPLEYPYSTAPYMFMEKLIPHHFAEIIKTNFMKFGELSTRQKRQLVGTDVIPDSWLIFNGCMIMPSSYLNLNKAKAFWNNNVKSFMFDMNRTSCDANRETISADVLDLRTSGMTDMEVCGIIDKFCSGTAAKSFHFFESHDRSHILNVLTQKALPPEQIRRCLWV